MDIPLRKRIFEYPKYVKSRQKRVISAAILTAKPQKKKFGDPLKVQIQRAAGNKAVITSNSALKSSESKLFNAGSTIKIGHFLDDIESSEIKVPKPEIS